MCREFFRQVQTRSFVTGNPPFVHSLLVFPFQYNIKKREEVQEMTQEEPNPLMRKKKTPEELAAEAEAEDEDEITSMYTSQLHSLITLGTHDPSRRAWPGKPWPWNGVKNEKLQIHGTRSPSRAAWRINAVALRHGKGWSMKG